MSRSCLCNTLGIARALHNTFVVPASRSVPALTFAASNLQLVRTHNDPRFFSITTARAKLNRPKQRNTAPAKRIQKFDEEITAKTIRLVNEDGSLSEPVNAKKTLAALDRAEERLLLLTELDVEFPLCKIVNKKAMYEAEKKKREQSREQKKSSRVTSSTKQLELNWAIDTGDLSHRLNKIKEFLEEGRRVEVILAAKKRGRAATPEECDNVIRKIREVIESVPGASVKKELEGPRGGFASMMLVGKITESAQEVSNG